MFRMVLMAVSLKLRFEVFQRDNFTCQYCGKKTPEVILEIEHIIPVSKGGTDEPDNLTTSCFECNRGKGANLLDTILKDKNVHHETVLLAEKEFQLAEYNHLKNKIRERENKEITELINHFVSQFPENDRKSAGIEFPQTIIRQCLKITSYVDIFEIIETAIAITSRNTKGDLPTVAAAKYLTAILRNKLRTSNNSPTISKKM
jgi:hypothetical protein